jgi:hypothetical protein|tara:strand:- start:1474 stop:1728 length:255 start_codon:yes stop_codon:yes gene_type:complete
MSEIKTLKVNTDKEREQWIDLLYHCVNFHESIAEEVKSDILGDEESKAMFMYHSSMANAVRDAIGLIQMWEVTEDDDIKELPAS